jgi:hypothetical protein
MGSDIMDQALEDLVSALRKLIGKASASGLEHGDNSRALRQALALLWSAHDEIAALRERQSSSSPAACAPSSAGTSTRHHA